MCKKIKKCRIITVANQKGGVAKTTTSIHLGVGLAQLGQKVLLVDSDPQGHLTLGLGFSKNIRITLKNMMENIVMGGEFDPREAILRHKEGVDIVPSNKLLTGMDISLITVDEREKVLKEYLDLLVNDYDYIIIDCMPSLGMLTVNAISAANSVLIPVQPQYYAADGLMELLKVVNGIKKRHNPEIQIEGILFTIDTSRYNNSKRNKKAVMDAYGNNINIFAETIPRTECIAETASEGVSIFKYDRHNKGAESYRKLALEVLGCGSKK
jgi:chromosome partitioning protein